MRLLLDEHLSWRRVAAPLRDRGHDVVTAQEDPDLRTLSDAELLHAAEAQGRVLVTCNGRHFEPLARDWADVGRDHAGLLIVWTLDPSRHEAIVEAVAAVIVAHPSQEAWRNLVLAV